MQATFFNKEAYDYPVDFKRRQKNNIGQHRAVDENSPFQDSVYLFSFHQSN